MGNRPVLPRNRAVTLWSRLLLAGLAFVFSLVLAEIAVRATGIAGAPFESTTTLHLYHTVPNGPVHLTPNWQGYVSGFWTVINEDGLRDRTFPEWPPPGAWRVLMIGDSYTMGDGVPLEHTYAKQLERMLGRDAPCEFINAAVSNTNSANQLAILPELLDRYHPSTVILGYNVNDFTPEARTRFDSLREFGFAMEVDEDGRVTVRSTAFGSSGPHESKLRRHCALYRLAVRSWKSWRSGPVDPIRRVREVLDSVVRGNHIQSFDAVQKMNELCQRHGVRFIAFILPGLLNSPAWLSNMKDYPHQVVHAVMCEELEKRGVEVHDLSGAFNGRDPRRLTVSSFDRHYNREGNRLLAERAATILQPKLLSKLSKDGPTEVKPKASPSDGSSSTVERTTESNQQED